MTRPRLGLTLDVAEDGGRYFLKKAYADAVWRAGGLPVPLVHPLPEGSPEGAAALLAGVDGLVVTGGVADVPPELYGEARRPQCGRVNPARSAAELALLSLALAGRVPVLGVCGGMQLLAVALGGALWQDLPTDLEVGGHEQPHPKDVPSHEVIVEAGSLLARLVGGGVLRVNSTHHQAVREPGRAAVVARAPDGVIEAVELADHPFALGVQWHPESAVAHEARHLAVYAGLVEAARRRR